MTARWSIEADDRAERGGVAMLSTDVESMWSERDRNNNGDGYGDGYGFGDGYGNGYGDGDGNGNGYGDGDDYGDGVGDGDGYGDGYVQIWIDWRDNALAEWGIAVDWDRLDAYGPDAIPLDPLAR